MHELLPLNAKDFDRLPADLVGCPVYYRVDEKAPDDGTLKVWPRPPSSMVFYAGYPVSPGAINTAGRFAADVVPMKE